MKELLILRHAKSSWKHADVGDHDRPLNKRGKEAAPRMGALLADEDLLPDLVVSSTARRAHSTAKLVSEAAGYDGLIELDRAIYGASTAEILRVIAETRESVQRLLIVGHNPGFEELVLQLTGSYERFPTAALAHVELGIESWREAPHARGRLLSLWRPRELD